jgi:PGF-pre-PGF domain-containing protein
MTIDPTAYQGAFNVSVNATDYFARSTIKTWVYTEARGEPILRYNIPTYFSTAGLPLVFVGSEVANISYQLYYYDNITAINTSASTSNETRPYVRWPVTIDTSGYDEGTYTIVVTANDTEGNEVVVEKLLYADNDVPIYSTVSSGSGPYYRTNNITLSIAGVNDNNDIDTVVLLYNTTGAMKAKTASGVGTYTATLTPDLLTGASSIHWRFNVTDVAGNSNLTALQELTITNRLPQWNSSAPTKFVWAKKQINKPWIDLNNYVYDQDNDGLTYYATTTTGGAIVTFSRVYPSRMYVDGPAGSSLVTIEAHDGFNLSDPTTLNITIAYPTADACDLSGTKIGFDSICSSGDDDDDDDDGGGSSTGGGSSGGGGSGTGGGSSGGGGSGRGYAGTYASATLSESHAYNVISPQFPAVFDIRSTAIPVDVLTVTPALEYTGVRLTVSTTERTLPAQVYRPVGYNVLYYLIVDHENLPAASIRNAKFTFRVNASQIPRSSVVRFLRYTGNTWAEIPVTYLRSEGVYKYYEAVSPGLSVFAIATQQQGPATPPPSTTGDVVKDTATPSCYDGIKNQGEEEIDCGGPCSVCPEVASPQSTMDETGSANGSMIGWLLGVVVLLAALMGSGAYIFVKQQQGKGTVDEGFMPESGALKSVPAGARTQYAITDDMTTLQKYIRTQLNKGVALPRIQDALLQAGWDAASVREECSMVLIQDAIQQPGTSGASVSGDDDLYQNFVAPGMESYVQRGDEKQTSSRVQEVDDEVMDNLYDYAANLYFADHDRESMTTHLQEQGWDEEHVSAALSYTQTLEDLDDKVGAWLSSGYSKEQVKSHLLSLGWSIYVVYELLKRK